MSETSSPDGKGGRALRVGVVNLMPRLETYEPSLVALFAAAEHVVEPVWLRLESHAYRSSDPAHLAARYTSYERAIGAGPLDGLVLTGAPVEHLPLAEVRYWAELSELLDHARRAVASTLGICWGAMALAEREGLAKAVYATKIFGVFPHTVAPCASSSLGLSARPFVCPHSRFAGFERLEVARAEREGRILALADGGDAGPTLLATPDERVFMHLGHPEYEPRRIGYEWRRDEAAGRSDVPRPQGYDLDRDLPHRDWRAASAEFIRGWVARIAR